MSVFEAGDLKLDLAARRVTRSGAEVHLTPTEYWLLAELVKHAGKVLAERHLLNEVWGPGYVERPHYLRVHMANLRQKLEHDPARPRCCALRPGSDIGWRRSEELLIRHRLKRPTSRAAGPPARPRLPELGHGVHYLSSYRLVHA